MEAEFVTEGDETRLQLRSVESDGTPRNFFDTNAPASPTRASRAAKVRLDQIAPGVYEAELGALTPGAYALRFVQTKPGETPLARTVMLSPRRRPNTGCWAPTSDCSPRCAARPAAEALEEGAQAWKHDLGTTTAATDLMPWLLLLALLLWPLDVAIRRVSLARGDLALARAWTAARWRPWRGPARRPQQVGDMLAAASRAGGAQSRAALLKPENEPDTNSPRLPPSRPPARAR